MKTKEELNTLKEEVEALNEKLSSLTEEELEQVTGGRNFPVYHNPVYPHDANPLPPRDFDWSKKSSK